MAEPKVMEDMGDELCNYCESTDFGKTAFVQTPNGPLMCEGAYCKTAYQSYLDKYADDHLADWYAQQQALEDG